MAGAKSQNNGERDLRSRTERVFAGVWGGANRRSTKLVGAIADALPNRTPHGWPSTRCDARETRQEAGIRGWLQEERNGRWYRR